MDCLFCNIINKQIPAAVVFEDEETLAFLDIHPLTKGHCLVIPKAHAENVFDISNGDLAAVAATAKAVAAAMKQKLQAEGINLLQSNGSIANQVIFHFHLHVIPRYDNDGITGNWGHVHPAQADMQELQETARILDPRFN